MAASRPVEDKAVLDKVAEITNSQASYKAKYDMLDLLWFTVTNYHPDGLGAAVLDVIAEAQTKVLYPEKGGDD